MASLKRYIRALQHKDPDVRKSAARDLAIMGDPQAVEPLGRAMKDEDWSVRLNVAMALGVIGDQRAAEFLARALEDTDASVRRRSGP